MTGKDYLYDIIYLLISAHEMATCIMLGSVVGFGVYKIKLLKFIVKLNTKVNYTLYQLFETNRSHAHP